ncbi:MAG: Activator of osmoprotectant transporter ProP [uncultured Paraburkholderia sp.]|nr:MAG: Activator of osmoprotectant transporter ProP [uncultured Paraburkholderia sp.]CAH2792930.1 MAG: Activator of osmoprotectant transporter ProP [uncultured Paraburkholderia sp.]CAH2927666.1 MAG: Activator of osmoprotectant transporter ProP [uncultured Paraburkholderia sp.]
MGFEQLAELKKQLAAARAQAAPAAKGDGKSGARSEGRSETRRDVRSDGKPAANSAKPDTGKGSGARAGARPAGKPAQAPRGAPQATPAADARPVDPVVKSIGRLQKRFPNTFPKNPAPKLPLKVGIFEDLVVHAKELSLSEAELRDAIKTWCRGSRYWKCLVEGAARVDLTGAEAGKVTAQEAAGAQRLQAHRAAKSAKAAAGAAAAGDTQKDASAQAASEQVPQEAAQEASQVVAHQGGDSQPQAQAADASPDDKVAAQSANLSETAPATPKA